MTGNGIQRLKWWAHKGSNLGPLPCEGNALPLSYAPGNLPHRPRNRASAGKMVVRGCDLRSAGHQCQAMNGRPGKVSKGSRPTLPGPR